MRETIIAALERIPAQREEVVLDADGGRLSTRAQTEAMASSVGVAGSVARRREGLNRLLERGGELAPTDLSRGRPRQLGRKWIRAGTLTGASWVPRNSRMSRSEAGRPSLRTTAAATSSPSVGCGVA